MNPLIYVSYRSSEVCGYAIINYPTPIASHVEITALQQAVREGDRNAHDAIITGWRRMEEVP